MGLDHELDHDLFNGFVFITWSVLYDHTRHVLPIYKHLVQDSSTVCY